ncbi:hypothetical protein JCM25156A_03570 [Komagataeibacter kakiaceti JCM 25156]
MLLRLEDTVSVKDFGAKGDGTTNDDAAIQNALTAICAHSPSPGGELFFPAGDYVISASAGHSIPCAGVTIRGTGGGAHQPGGSRFVVRGSGNASLFQFNMPVPAGDKYFYGGRLTSVAFTFANTPEAVTQTGYAVEFDHCAGCLVDHVYSYGAYNLFKAYSGFKNRFHDFYAKQMASSPALHDGYAVAFTGDYCASGPGGCATRGDVTEIFDFHVDEMLSSARGFVPGSCIHLSGFAATTWIRHGTCNQPSIGLKIDCPNAIQIGECPQFIHIDRMETEINALNNVDRSACLDSTDLVHLEAYSFQCFGYNRPDNLIRIVASGAFAGAGHVEFYGGKVEGAAGSCVTFAAKDFKFIGGDIMGCNQRRAAYSRSADTFGILLQAQADGVGADSGSFVVSGVNFCGGSDRTSTTAMGAVRIDPKVAYGTITGNVFRGCAGGVADNSREKVNVVANNSGP